MAGYNEECNIVIVTSSMCINFATTVTDQAKQHCSFSGGYHYDKALSFCERFTTALRN